MCLMIDIVMRWPSLSGTVSVRRDERDLTGRSCGGVCVHACVWCFFKRHVYILYSRLRSRSLPLGSRQNRNNRRIISARVTATVLVIDTGHSLLLFTLYSTLSSFLETRLYIPPFLGSEAMFFIRELIVARVQGSS